MKRIFWALPVDIGPEIENSEQIKKSKVSAKKKGVDVRWVPPENFHVTLCFIGEVEEEVIPDLVQRAASALEEFEELNLKVKGAGGFPDDGHARVIWLGVQAKKELVRLRDALVNEMKKTFEFKERDFVPHLTLGRLKNRKNLSDIISPLSGKEFGKIQAKEVVLYESVLGGPFPKYETLEKISIRSG